jgi:hypothetical protein
LPAFFLKGRSVIFKLPIREAFYELFRLFRPFIRPKVGIEFKQSERTNIVLPGLLHVNIFGYYYAIVVKNIPSRLLFRNRSIPNPILSVKYGNIQSEVEWRRDNVQQLHSGSSLESGPFMFYDVEQGTIFLYNFQDEIVCTITNENDILVIELINSEGRPYVKKFKIEHDRQNRIVSFVPTR